MIYFSLLAIHFSFFIFSYVALKKKTIGWGCLSELGIEFSTPVVLHNSSFVSLLLRVYQVPSTGIHETHFYFLDPRRMYAGM